MAGGKHGASADADRAAAANAVEPVSRLQHSQHPLRVQFEVPRDELLDLLAQSRWLLTCFAAIQPGNGWDDDIGEARRLISEIDAVLS